MSNNNYLQVVEKEVSIGQVENELFHADAQLNRSWNILQIS